MVGRKSHSVYIRPLIPSPHNPIYATIEATSKIIYIYILKYLSNQISTFQINNFRYSNDSCISCQTQDAKRQDEKKLIQAGLDPATFSELLAKLTM